MKLEHKISPLGKHEWLIEIDESELAMYTSGIMEVEMKKLFNHTRKMSDGLMYLSEVVKNIEESV